MKEYNSIILDDKDVDALLELEALMVDLPYSRSINMVKFDKSADFNDSHIYITVWYEEQHVVGLVFEGLEDNLKKLPKCISNFSKLRKLFFICCEIPPFPSSFKNLTNLEELEFSYYQDSYDFDDGTMVFPSLVFSDVIQEFINLRRIIIRGLFNVYFSPSFTNIPNLEELHLSDCICTSNQSTHLRNSKFDPNNMESWKTLSFSDFPEDLGKITSLEKLILDNINIEYLPSSLISLPKLKDLELRGSSYMDPDPSNYENKRIKNIEIIFKIISLEKLILHNCRMETIPNIISNLINLREFIITYNCIKVIPPEIKKCQKIVKIDLRSNPIKKKINMLKRSPKPQAYKNQ